MSSLIQDFATFKKRLARLPVVAHRAGENSTNRRFKDGRALFPQEWRSRGHQGWSAHRQRAGTRLGVRRTSRPLGPAPYGRREDSRAI
jgi:hypothetical protein